ncbi:MAG: hypothetical protein LH660_18935 [Phormidesmis sp. CAN_BIN36]|nr:hypothetical protein [Phormidesmis sp. CAN_BIN36]
MSQFIVRPPARILYPHPSPLPREREQESLAPFSLGRRVGDEGYPGSRRRSVQFTAIAVPETQAQSANTSSIDCAHESAVQDKLVAQWLLDENSKLYCRWVIAD